MATQTKQKKTAAEKKTVEIGVSGTNIFSGIITEEYNSKLSGLAAIKVYDEMRKSDASVRAALLAVTLPIRRAQWFVTGASEDEKDEEIRSFVESALFEYMSITWDDFLRQALLMTNYGVMVFEKVFEIKTVNGSVRVCWRKFAPRLPKSISAWQTKDGQDGITQSTATGHEASIPIDKLLVFVNEKEGDNWWGMSLLRPIYKHWWLKSGYEHVNSIGHERQGLGVPYVRLPEGSTTDADVSKAETILTNLRASESAYLIIPNKYEVGFLDMNAAGVKKATEDIEHQDRQITKGVLAQFLNLGSGSTGSRALSEDQSALFLQSLEATANYIADVINRYAIPQLVDLNFEGVGKYPKLDYTGIQRTDVAALSTAYQRVIQSGGVKARDEDERYLREVMGLPAVPEDEASSEDKDVDDETEDLGLSEFSKKKIYTDVFERKIETRLNEMSMAGKMKFLEQHIEKIKSFKNHKHFFEPVLSVLSRKYWDIQRLVMAENNNFKSWRSLTFAEKKVNFNSIQDFITKNEAKMTDESREILKEAREEFSTKLSAAAAKGDTKKIKDLSLGFQRDYKELVKGTIKDSYEFGKTNAAREMGVKTPGSPKEISAMIEVAADTITEKHTAEIVTEAKLALTERISRGEGVVSAAAAADVAAAKAIETLTRDTARIVVSGYINKGRDTVFSINKNKIHALQRSEILDSVTCNFCLSVDGRIVDQDDSMARLGVFHTNCRGIWVEILKEEEELPKVTGVPDSIRDRIGDATNELIQPKNPIVKKDSLAAKAIAKGKAGQSASELISTDPESYKDCGKLP